MRYWIVGLFLMLSPFSSIAGDYEFIPFAGLGVVSEGRRSPNLYGKVGFLLRSPLYKKVTLEADAALSLYRITYFGLPYEAVLSGSETVSAFAYPTEEKRYDYCGLLSYPLLKNKFQLDILAGYRRIQLINNFSSFDIGGPLIGISGGSPYKHGNVRLKVDVTPVLVIDVDNHRNDIIPLPVSRSNSILGDPTVVTKYSLIWQAPHKKNWGFKFGYEGETLFFRGTQRFYNGLNVSLIF